jgi:23S rRNA (cytidine1920-2'-O)/16S rRNA (cytidine1409-2'-O)-methyltransferase
LKLDAALRRCGLEVAGLACLDVGQGSGGFTDVLLAHGAAHVTGVDVGHDQLVARLCNDARVTAYQGLNARTLSRADLGDAVPAAGYDMVVGDVSFISSALVWPALAPLMAAGGHLLWLIKPQFELQPAQIGKGGVVRSGEHGLYAQIEERLRETAAACGLRVLDWFDSTVTGGGRGNQAGNREFFLHAARGGAPERQDHDST